MSKYLPAFGCDYGAAEMEAAKAVLDTGRLTFGPVAAEAEKEFAARFLFPGAPAGVFVNSGSSACMLALDAIAHCLPAGTERRLITTALGFPTVMAAALRLGFRVVVLDSEPDTLNFDPAQLREAAARWPQAVLLFAHMMGNPFDVAALLECSRHAFTVADCCDALGSTWAGRQLAEYASVAAYALYPAHHLTCGEGGMILSRGHGILATTRSLRDWGRDCECLPNQDNRCGHRFDHRLGGVGWDHKFIYSHQGYNLKPLEPQAAILRVQLSRQDELHGRRAANIAVYDAAFDTERLGRFFARPQVLPRAEASWMAYPLMIRPSAGFGASEFAQAMEAEGVGTRRPLGGDLTEQPAFKSDPRIEKPYPLNGTREVMESVVCVGCHPRLSRPDIARIVETAIIAAKRLRVGFQEKLEESKNAKDDISVQ